MEKCFLYSLFAAAITLLTTTALAAPDPDEAELELRKQVWKSRAFLCPSKAGNFPSKEDESGAPRCDDGDSVMFNALLCRAGDKRGCKAVQLSQDRDGRFWRSPEKRRLRPEEPGGLTGGETTFSGDHAVGLMVYFGHTKDKKAFRNWIRWIDGNERCLTFCGLMPAGTARYCKNDRCALRLGDCQTLILLGERLSVGVPFCSADPIGQIPTVTNIAKTLKNTYDETIGKFPIQPPELKLLRDNFDKALKAYQDAMAEVDKLRTKVHALLVRESRFPQIEKALSAKLNARGYSRHNAMVQIMMLEDWGHGHDWMSSEARKIARDEPLNPFFQYVATRRGSKDSMLKPILNACPGKDDPMQLRRQWSWERDSEKKEWLNTMYWDCLFIAAMYEEKRKPPNAVSGKVPALLGDLNGAIASATRNATDVKAILKEIEELLQAVKQPGKAVNRKIDEKKTILKNPKKGIEKKIEKKKKNLFDPNPLNHLP